jgi:dihydroxy-acid dehydratase
MSQHDDQPVVVRTSAVDGQLTSYGDPAFSRFLRRAFLNSAGLDDDDLDRPIIGIAHTISDYTTCHRHMPQLVDAVRRGVLEAGGLPFSFPVPSLGEILMSPTTMLYRNLLALTVEELILAQPMDAVVLVGGCDKTIPAMLMGALSADTPAIVIAAGPMYSGSWRGQRLGACTDCRNLWARHRAGELDDDDITESRAQLAPTGGTCMVMGTASTMAILTEALGMALIGTATAPAPSGDRLRSGVAVGRRAVAIADEQLRPRSIVGEAAIRNALTMLVAIGGSTNAVIHLAAIAKRAGLSLSVLDELAEISRRTPLIVDCKPAGSGYLPDVHAAGGSGIIFKALVDLLDTEAPTVHGVSLSMVLSAQTGPPSWQRVVRTVDDPVGPVGGLAVLRGSLAPDGAVLKCSATNQALLLHTGPAAVFESPDDLAARIDDPALGLTPDHIVVVRNAGPIAAGMPEAGSAPIPRYLARAGVTDMVRVSDARMSGTASGTVVLHISPEAAAGGPLALVRDGDLITLDVAAGRLDLLVDDDVLAARKQDWVPPPPPERGWRRLHHLHVGSATEGADFDFC